MQKANPANRSEPQAASGLIFYKPYYSGPLPCLPSPLITAFSFHAVIWPRTRVGKAAGCDYEFLNRSGNTKVWRQTAPNGGRTLRSDEVTLLYLVRTTESVEKWNQIIFGADD